ncbi:phosphonate metabolism protein/1,5-bisphosphokinase (PRPP-forming) PhnN [Agrobacterium rhizogenes]|uniref:phosphonate metabolism protein/1,5-bisphosphokinase (PRPP-forming) PhnN n=1 Tax=Rhizobium rhizogenes TaxID=359 RepID=UPI00056CC839|nr:phosphonate metabolism protein/1,5-bisphosphokinase (PRPP-forming) PhnN [Rhizobium rhizogenes]NTF66428.1 phosphonate metabolism protein/1,5-bisphosphokinase (PRPP-forming) PhnN [Rhizobium rhizogenes]NTF79550.1 phosphonate metabolism protein/1,5-bisphosphokinase (PRPP-forming) PhnN [Rhizobium rhizogenes]NTH75643.1 phosphonate metabolism protein/1,5-bisphosphokinase (PRPP-forming) PhnN [Rhizobium rhizogenes]NTH81649.1 phosphonate metabolism protein/1,5-bisphosphokinase (PRPP-forming) PhnN [Rhi
MTLDAKTEPTKDLSANTAGIMVVVVGPSGAGKDTLMNLAARHFAGRSDIHFVRRVITRDGDAGNEDHRSVSDADFDAMEQDGAFAVSWEAHGLKYGIPSDVEGELANGHLVVANGSRSVLHRFQTAFPKLKVINVTARREVLAERLIARGRESREDVLKRLERGSLTVQGSYDVADIDNSGTLEEAGRVIVAELEALIRK